MKQLKTILTASAIALSTMTFGAYANTAALDQLLQEVKADRISEAKINKSREAEFRAARDQKQALLNKAKKELADEQARQKSLQQTFTDNEKRITDKTKELDDAKGTLGEMFGVVRQASGETVGRIATSIISAQPAYANRTELLAKLAEAKELPKLAELEELWFALQTEMTESAKVVKFDANVVALDGSESVQTVTRVGAFNLLSNDAYLKYNSESNQIEPLGRQPEGHMVATVADFNGTSSGYASLFLDPSRGAILDIFKQKATLEERYHQGGVPGYVITVVLLFGILISVERFITLTVVGAKIRGQLKDLSNPRENNPLGRILGVYASNKNVDTETLELKLDEAILRETPRIERGVNVIKILAAIAPLLGLLGTVTGMIGTFQSITLFGTGDPKIMAGDISMALVTTAQGLIAALPLIFLHSITAAKSKSIVHVLEEQSAGIVASHAEKERA
ncbi:TonB system biopolymer transport component [Catenovulum agarivorans DS-2]|uniref:TonB system biopolymer transport component n=1 Tax=Catenovulum agarivorans DS-2 TaxID=1328313 RepID=W7QCN5_9ALTE|nr:MotA/TolQ/ExbB proton channel family protein [Catenovulum agarivorans]EWH09671.1 TonB system biopolymer transport component [Catenovulum agarivorans DS-2]